MRTSQGRADQVFVAFAKVVSGIEGSGITPYPVISKNMETSSVEEERPYKHPDLGWQSKQGRQVRVHSVQIVYSIEQKNRTGQTDLLLVC